MTLALPACAAMLPLLALAPTLPALALGLFLFARTSALLDVAMNAHGLQVERRHGRPLRSSFHASWSFGGLAAAAVDRLVAAADRGDAGAVGVGARAASRCRRRRSTASTRCESGRDDVCRLRYEAPKRLLLTAQPTAPLHLPRLDGGRCIGAANPCVLDLTADEPVVSVFALFNPSRLKVRVSAPDGDTTSKVTGPGGPSTARRRTSPRA